MSQSRPSSAIPSKPLLATPIPDDFTLMAGIRARDAAAMTLLYDRYSALVYTACLRGLRDTSDAEDLLVDIFSELWERCDRFDPARGNPGGHIMGLTRSRLVDRLRSRRSAIRGMMAGASEIDSVSGMRARSPGPLEQVMSEERRGEVIRAVQSLPVDQRESLELAFFEAMSHAEVAEKLGQPLGTIKSRIRQALLHLREILGRRE